MQNPAKGNLDSRRGFVLVQCLVVSLLVIGCSLIALELITLYGKSVSAQSARNQSQVMALTAVLGKIPELLPDLNPERLTAEGVVLKNLTVNRVSLADPELLTATMQRSVGYSNSSESLLLKRLRQGTLRRIPDWQLLERSSRAKSSECSEWVSDVPTGLETSFHALRTCRNLRSTAVSPRIIIINGNADMASPVRLSMGTNEYLVLAILGTARFSELSFDAGRLGNIEILSLGNISIETLTVGGGSADVLVHSSYGKASLLNEPMELSTCDHLESKPPAKRLRLEGRFEVSIGPATGTAVHGCDFPKQSAKDSMVWPDYTMIGSFNAA